MSNGACKRVPKKESPSPVLVTETGFVLFGGESLRRQPAALSGEVCQRQTSFCRPFMTGEYLRGAARGQLEAPSTRRARPNTPRRRGRGRGRPSRRRARQGRRARRTTGTYSCPAPRRPPPVAVPPVVEVVATIGRARCALTRRRRPAKRRAGGASPPTRDDGTVRSPRGCRNSRRAARRSRTRPPARSRAGDRGNRRRA